MEDDLFSQARKAAEKVRRTFRGNVHAIVLYGSVARGEETEESDIDLFVIVSDKEAGAAIKDFIRKAGLFNISIIAMTRREAEKKISPREYFWRDMLEQGVILYDNGTYVGIREKAFGKGRAVPVRR